MQSSTFRKKPWGQLAPEVLDLVACKNIWQESLKSDLVVTEKLGHKVKLCNVYIFLPQ